MNRPLTEELQSVLREHALTAPTPHATIDAVFARLGLEPASAEPESGLMAAERMAAESSAAERAAAPAIDESITPGRPSRRLLLLTLGGAAAAVLLLGGTVGLIRMNNQGARSASSAGRAMAQAGGAASAGSSAVSGKVSAAGKQPGVTGPRPGVQAGSLPGIVGCSEAQTIMSTTVAPVLPGGSGALSTGLTIGYASCVDADGMSGTGAVVLYRSAGGSGPRDVVRILIPQSRSLRLVSVSLNGDVVAVRAIDGARGQDLGSVSDYRFSVSDDGTILAQSTTLVAPGCTAADLTPSIVDQPSGAVLRLTDTGPRACAVSGVPQLMATAGASLGSPLPPQLVAPSAAGQAHSGLVVLTPGASSSARLLRPAGRASPACAGSVTGFVVGLPDTGRIGVVAYRGSSCTGTVSALVPGTGG